MDLWIECALLGGLVARSVSSTATSSESTFSVISTPCIRLLGELDPSSPDRHLGHVLVLDRDGSSRGRGGANRSPSLLDPGRPTGQAAQVVKLGAANAAVAQDFDLVDARRVDQEGPLDADSVRCDAANREVLVDAASSAAG